MLKLLATAQDRRKVGAELGHKLELQVELGSSVAHNSSTDKMWEGTVRVVGTFAAALPELLADTAKNL